MVSRVRVVVQDVTVRQTVVVALSELTLVAVHFVQFAPHLGVTTAHLPTENVATLRGCTRLPLDGAWAIPVDLSHHLHLIGVVHYEFFCVASIGCSGALRTRNNFTLRSHSWNFVVIFLYW